MLNPELPRGVAVALCGPSGVGKGYTKELIKRRLPVELNEPIVVTTRPARSDDGISRRAGLSPKDFHDLVEAGEVVLPHQPFRQTYSHWYGFAARSLNIDGHILTEVHSTLLPDFRQNCSNHRVLIIGMLGDLSTRFANVSDRGPIDKNELNLRIAMGQKETDEIKIANEAGLVDVVFDCSFERRDQAQLDIVKLVEQKLEGGAS